MTRNGPINCLRDSAIDNEGNVMTTWTKEALQFEAGKAYCILSYYDWVYATFPFNSRLNLNRTGNGSKKDEITQ